MVFRFNSVSESIGAVVEKDTKQIDTGPIDDKPALARQLEEARQALLLTQDDQAQLDSLSKLMERDNLSSQDKAMINELSDLLEGVKGSEQVVEQISRDAQINVEIDEDGWRAKMDLKPPLGSGNYITPMQVVQALTGIGVTHGINRKAIAQAIRSHREDEYVEGCCVAIGRSATNGKDGRFEVYFRKGLEGDLVRCKHHKKLPKLPSERMCEAGDLVGKHYPPVPGKPGYTILGEVLHPDPVSDQTLGAGDNVTRQGDEYIAKVQGTIETAQDQLLIKRLLVLAELSNDQKKIEFDGEIQIDCNLDQPTTIVATGNVVVNGSVGPAVIHSSEQSVYLHQGVAGQGQAYVYAARCIHARFAEQAILQAGEKIVLDVGSLHAMLAAGDRIESTQGKGTVVGGLLLAGTSISVKHLGNQGGVLTRVICGLPTEHYQRQVELELKRTMLEIKLERLNTNAAQIRRMAGDISRLSAESKQVYAQLLQSILAIRAEQSELTVSIGEDDESYEVPEASRVDILGNVYPNCRISLGQQTMKVSRPARSRSVVIRSGQIQYA